MANEQPKPWVKAHLDKQGVKWADLKADTKKALNKFSEAEIKKLDDLGIAFEDDGVPTNVRVSAVH